MVDKNIVKQPKSKAEVQVIVPWADLEPFWNQTLQRLATEVEVSGFRKGQAPQAMVESRLGNKLQDEALKTAMPQFLIEALKGTEIVPIDYPKYQVVAFTKGQQLAFKADLTTRPQVQVGDYRSIKAQRLPLKPVTDEMVEKVIQDLYRRWKTRQPQGQSTPSNQPTGAHPQASSGGSINFNQSSGAQSVGGQPPAAGSGPDDKFAQGVGATSLADLRMKLRADLESEAKYNNELDFEEAILQEVAKLTQVEMPEILVEDELARMLVTLQRRVTEMGLLLEDYLKSQNETVEGLKKKWREQAEKNVKMELGLSEVARRENIQISDEQLKSEIDKIQDARLKAQFEAEEPRLHFRHSLRQIKTLDFLKGIIH